MAHNPFNSRRTLKTKHGSYTYFALDAARLLRQT